MKPLKLKVVSDEGVEAAIFSDGSQGGAGDFYSVVSIAGYLEDKKIYGVDPIQSFFLGTQLIEKLIQKSDLKMMLTQLKAYFGDLKSLNDEIQIERASENHFPPWPRPRQPTYKVKPNPRRRAHDRTWWNTRTSPRRRKHR